MDVELLDDESGGDVDVAVERQLPLGHDPPPHDGLADDVLDLLAEVGGGHERVGQDLLGMAVRDDEAEVEHGDAAAHLGHELDVVLDEHDRAAEALDGISLMWRAERHGLVAAQAGGGLVEEGHHGAGRHGGGHLEHAAGADVDEHDRLVGRGQPEEADDLVHRGGVDVAVGVEVDVVPDVQLGDRPALLERATQAVAGPLRRGVSGRREVPSSVTEPE